MKQIIESLSAQLARAGEELLPRGSRNGSVEVTLLSSHLRKNSATGSFRLASGNTSIEVFVKTLPPEGIRNILKQEDDPASAFAREYAILDQVYQEFKRADSPHLQAIEPLTCFDDPPALVMHRVEGTPFRKALRDAHRFCRSKNLERICRLSFHAGAWLSRFHRIPIAVKKTRGASWEENLQEFEQLLGFLESNARSHWWAKSVRARFENFQQWTHSPDLRCAVSHGDYALRNIFVGKGDAIVAFDTQANQRAPIYWDLAYFVTSVRTFWLQAATFGTFIPRPTADRIKEALVAGYSLETPVDPVSFDFFCLYALLDKWRTSLIHFQSGVSGFRKATLSVRGYLLQHLIAAELGSTN